MNPEQIQRYARQISLPEVGPDGQARLCAARVLIVGSGPAAETAAAYLHAAGIGAVILRAVPPADGAAWLQALTGVDLVVRTGFDDDAMLAATKHLGTAVVVARATPAAVDIVSFPERAPAPDTSSEVPVQAAAASTPGAADVLAGALAAVEALVSIARVARVARVAADGEDDGVIARIRHLRLPLDGGTPLAQEIGAP